MPMRWESLRIWAERELLAGVRGDLLEGKSSGGDGA